MTFGEAGRKNKEFKKYGSQPDGREGRYISYTHTGLTRASSKATIMSINNWSFWEDVGSM